MTWLQHVGETPVVNPTKHPWTVPSDQKPSLLAGVGWFLYALSILVVLVVFFILYGGAAGAFIYAGF